MKIKVGSLFDGIGGTPLSAVLSGAEPVWASEIEKVPISITKRHFPNMKHYGDITQINGADIEPVDIIVGGSPCQDLSVAGKRAGLEGERSGLFMDQIRITKEMRNATRKETGDGSDELPKPRYMVWENVPGAFSSNKGEDFRAVLEEVCRIGEGEVSIPRPPKGKWSKSGSILGDGYSVAWRTVDAQHWGVPQRRRRIYLVADFGGHTAPEICFEREGVSGGITEGGETGQRVAADAERGTGSSVECQGIDGYNSTLTGNISSTLGVNCGMSTGRNGVIVKKKSVGFIGANGAKAHGIGYEVVAGRSNHVVTECIPVLNDQGGSVMGVSYGVTGTLRVEAHGHQPIVLDNQPEAVCSTTGSFMQVCVEKSPTLAARDYKSPPIVSRQNTLVRRLTPLECERLQGFPDGWTALDHEDKPVSDTQRYKALGNSFAIPNALFIISRCIRELGRASCQTIY